MKKVFILNGPNLNMLGTREPEIYGTQTLADIQKLCADRALQLGLEIDFFQSNDEAALIDKIHNACQEACAIIINPAAYSHTSIAILDALNIFEQPVIEVHLSNIHKRESFRHHSYVSRRADAVICGCGTHGYVYGLEYVKQLLKS